MAIKMRNNKDPNSVCCECGDPRREVLDMFDLCIGGTIVTICDRCNEVLNYKTLCAECNKNARVKTPEDMKVMRKRANGTYTGAFRSRWLLEQEEKRQATTKKGKD